MKRSLHAMAGLIAIAMIVLFIVATLYSEFSGNRDLIFVVKRGIAFPGIEILVCVMVLAGGSGRSLAKSRSVALAAKKARRMRFVALNGIAILIPCAILLAYWATYGILTARFYVVQSIEILAGLTNLTMLVLNMRDGLLLKRTRTGNATAGT